MTETDRGAEEAAVLAAADSLITDFGHHDVERYFAAFRPDASFVFHTHPERLDSVGAYRDLWRHWERDSGFRVIDCRSSNRRVDVYGTCAVFAHDVVTTVENTDGPRVRVQTATSERETIVFARSGGGWLAVHEHLFRSFRTALVGPAIASPTPASPSTNSRRSISGDQT